MQLLHNMVLIRLEDLMKRQAAPRKKSLKYSNLHNDIVRQQRKYLALLDGIDPADEDKIVALSVPYLDLIQYRLSGSKVTSHTCIHTM